MEQIYRLLGTVYFLCVRGGGLVGFGGGHAKNMGGHDKYFSKTLKWHSVLILKKVHCVHIPGRKGVV